MDFPDTGEMTRATPASGELAERRSHQFALVSVVAVVVLILLYVLAVRTRIGQEFDDIAFAGRSVEDPQVTRELNELLLSVTRSTLVLLTAALVVFALVRRRVRLALAVGLAVSISVVTTEVLKSLILERPPLDEIAGIAENSFPSGRATIGMSLSLGMVMVAAHRWRWAAMIAALLLSLTFGIGVLATGWHRPSDVIAAYLVCTTVFAAVTALLIRSAGVGDVSGSEFGEIEDRLTQGWALLLGILVVAAGAVALILSFTADGLDTVDFASDYIAVSVVILALGASVVTGYHELLRGVSLGTPHTHGNKVETS
jgi:membrane-associated phospholipid phosphatase